MVSLQWKLITVLSMKRTFQNKTLNLLKIFAENLNIYIKLYVKMNAQCCQEFIKNLNTQTIG